MNRQFKTITAFVFCTLLVLSSENTIKGQTFKIGQKYGGGIIFYLDKTGQHGLIASTFDQSKDCGWGKNADRSNNPAGLGIGTGAQNTAKILADDMIDANGAAYLCGKLKVKEFDDWFLPSLFELQLLYKNKNVIGGFSNEYYWSSSVVANTNIWILNFFDGSTCFHTTNKATCVRAIRAF
jgi:hypothetical protein